ncbi:MAG: threonine/serine dehydratase [Geminicoccaceae bacterium]
MSSTCPPTLPAPPTLEEIRATAELLRRRVVRTPVLDWAGPEIAARVLAGTRVNLKLELFQHTGSFKARGSLAVMLALSDAVRARGVTAVSAGNHAIATAWAARELGISAKVVMLTKANPARVERARRYGAELVMVSDVAEAFAIADRIAAEEGRTFVHPYEGPLTARGTGTVALEWLEQTRDLDAMIVPVGGGGLIAGMACAAKQIRPECLVIGVEPLGADSMWRSLAAGTPQKLERVATVADSLGAPYALPYSFDLCRRFVDEVVRIEDGAMIDAMRLALDALKLLLEPAGAAATAALLGPLRERFAGMKVGVLVCGSNIDLATYMRLVEDGTR